MNTHDGPPGSSGAAIPPAPAESDLGGFEERLLTELKIAVAERSALQRPVAASNVRRLHSRTAATRMPSPRRPLLAAVAAVAATAAGLVTIVAVLAPAAGPHPGRPAFGPATTPAGILHNAALAAMVLPAGAPRPDQFVYSDVVQDWPGIGTPISSQQWISADGTRPGLFKITGGLTDPPPGQRADGTGMLPFCRHGLLHDPPLRPVPCTADQQAGYHPAMPTRQQALRPYLLRLFALHNDPGNTGALLNGIEQLMTTNYLLPQQRAALDQFLARLPGLTVVPHVANMQGTVGVGVRVAGYKGGSWTIIFDPETYAPLGMNWTRLGHQHAGEIQASLAIVNKAGQLP